MRKKRKKSKHVPATVVLYLNQLYGKWRTLPPSNFFARRFLTIN